MAALDPQSSVSALLPEPFGKYALLGHLATGGMAEVWLARQHGLPGFDKLVVIKRARPGLGEDEATRGMLDEARLLATLDHPNIAQVYEIGQVNGACFFAMEYVEGADLRRVIETATARQHPIALGDALHIIGHVCTALHHAHEKLQITHRDVSPSNVLIGHDGAVKVCDFGIKGKVSYMSPEQCRSEPIDRRSDVFSLGILLYELTTLTKLFRAGGDFALLQKLVEQPIPPPSTRVAGYPPELEAIVMKALARHPDDRYQTALALQLELEAFAREQRLATSAVSVGKLIAALFGRRGEAALEPHLATGTPGAFDRPVVGQGSVREPALVPRALSSGTLPSTRSARVARVAPAPVVVGPRRWDALWLAGAAVAAMIAVGVTVAAQVVEASDDKAAAAALVADAERLSSAFDTAARAAHLRADGIAATPMLRSAIEAEKPSLRDLASAELIFTAHAGESLDVFQLRAGQATSLLHIPGAAPALPVLKGRETRVRLDGRDATLIASAPIAGYQDNLVGGLVIAMPVELAAVRRALAEHAERAIVRGLAGPGGGELVLAGDDRADAPMVALAVPPGGEWSSDGVSLRAIPRRIAGLFWAPAVRNLSGGLAVVLLLGFAIAFTRRQRRSASSPGERATL